MAGLGARVVRRQGLTSSALRAEVSEAILELERQGGGYHRAYLLEAETGWYDEGKCVDLVFDPGHMSLEPASGGTMAVALKGKMTTKNWLPTTVSINGGASVSPGNAKEAALRITCAVVDHSSGSYANSANDPVLTVDATSRRAGLSIIPRVEMRRR